MNSRSPNRGSAASHADDPLRYCPDCHYLFLGKHNYCPWHGVELRSLLGYVLEGFKIERLLSRAGGFGVVYYAKHTKSDQDAVIKVLKPPHCYRQETVMVFRHEAGKLKRVNCTQIPLVTNFDTTPWPWLRMVFCNGRTLQEEITELKKQGKAFSVRVAWGILRGIAKALSVTHAGVDEAGSPEPLMHRDLKPLNVILEKNPKLPAEDWVRVIDWGLAIKGRAESEPELIAWLKSAGTPDYMAPEQFRFADPSPANDVYAFGILAHELLSGGAYPYSKPKPSDIHDTKAWVEAWRAVHEKSPPTPMPRGIPHQLRKVVQKCLEKNPADRYPDGAALEKALRPPRVPMWGKAAVGSLVGAVIVLAVYLLLVGPKPQRFTPFANPEKWAFSDPEPNVTVESVPCIFYMESLKSLEDSGLKYVGEFQENMAIEGLSCEKEAGKGRIWTAANPSQILRVDPGKLTSGDEGYRLTLDLSALASQLNSSLPGVDASGKLFFEIEGRVAGGSKEEPTLAFYAVPFRFYFDPGPGQISEVTLSGPERDRAVRNIEKSPPRQVHKWFCDNKGPSPLALSFDVKARDASWLSSVVVSQGKEASSPQQSIDLLRETSLLASGGPDAKSLADFLRFALQDVFKIERLFPQLPSAAAGGTPLTLEIRVTYKARPRSPLKLPIRLSLDSGPDISVTNKKVIKLAGGKAEVRFQCREDSIKQAICGLGSDSASKPQKEASLKLTLEALSAGPEQLLSFETPKADPASDEVGVQLQLKDSLQALNSKKATLRLQVIEYGFCNIDPSAGIPADCPYDPVEDDHPLSLGDFTVEIGVKEGTGLLWEPAKVVGYPGDPPRNQFCLHTKKEPQALRLSLKDAKSALLNKSAARCSHDDKPLEPRSGSDYAWNVPGALIDGKESSLAVHLETIWGKPIDIPVILLYSKDLPRLPQIERPGQALSLNEAGGYSSPSGKDDLWTLKLRPTDKPELKNLRLTPLKAVGSGAPIDLAPHYDSASQTLTIPFEAAGKDLPEGSYILSFIWLDIFNNDRPVSVPYFIEGQLPVVTFPKSKVDKQSHLELEESGDQGCPCRVEIEDFSGISSIRVKRGQEILLDQETLLSTPPQSLVDHLNKYAVKLDPQAIPIEGSQKYIYTRLTLDFVIQPFEKDTLEVLVSDTFVKDRDQYRSKSQTRTIDCKGRWPDSVEYDGTTWLLAPLSEKPFYISAYEVSNDFYAEVLAPGGVSLPRDNLPKVGIEAKEALRLAEAKGYSLPTVSQWMYVARGMNHDYKIALDADKGDQSVKKLFEAVYCKPPNGSTQGFMPVNQEPQGMTGLKKKYPGLFGPEPGCFHLFGNAAEFVIDDTKGDPGTTSPSAFKAMGGHRMMPWERCRDRSGQDENLSRSGFTGFRLICFIDQNPAFKQACIDQRLRPSEAPKLQEH